MELMAGRKPVNYEYVFLFNYVTEQVNEEQSLTVRGPAQDCFLSAAPPLSTCTAVLHRADFSINLSIKRTNQFNSNRRIL